MFEKNQVIYDQKCRFLLNQIKSMNEPKWEDLIDEYNEIDIDESSEFFDKLKVVVKDLSRQN